jgi:hypothetical protein
MKHATNQDNSALVGGLVSQDCQGGQGPSVLPLDQVAFEETYHETIGTTQSEFDIENLAGKLFIKFWTYCMNHLRVMFPLPELTPASLDTDRLIYSIPVYCHKSTES